MPSLWENMLNGIDNHWNGRLTESAGGRTSNSPAARWDNVMGGFNDFWTKNHGEANGGGSTFAGTGGGTKPNQFSTPAYMSGASGMRAAAAPASSGGGNSGLVGGNNPIGQMLGRLQGINANTNEQVADTRSQEEIDMANAIEAIQRRIADPNGYALDTSYEGMVDEAFAGALGAVDKAESRTRDNYATSDKIIAGLTQGHVNAIKGEDMDLVKKIGADNQAAVGSIYDNGQKSLQDDRAREIADRTDAIQRLGLQESGLGNVGSVQNEQIAKNAGLKTAALGQAATNQTADEQLNVARASAQSAEGVSRQQGLRQDLDKILGNLDGKRAEIGNSKSQARLAGHQAATANAQKAMQIDSDTLDMYSKNKREDGLAAKKAAGAAKGTATKYDVARNRFSQQGLDPNPLIQAYSEVVGENKYNSNTGMDKKAFYIHNMRKKLSGRPEYDGVSIAEMVDMMESYGTDKGTAAG